MNYQNMVACIEACNACAEACDAVAGGSEGAEEEMAASIDTLKAAVAALKH